MLPWLIGAVLSVLIVWFGTPPLFRALIRSRLKGYRRNVNVVDESKPLSLTTP